MHFTSGNLPLSMHLCSSSACQAGHLPGRWGRRDDKAEIGMVGGHVLSPAFDSQGDLENEKRKKVKPVPKKLRVGLYVFWHMWQLGGVKTHCNFI